MILCFEGRCMVTGQPKVCYRDFDLLRRMLKKIGHHGNRFKRLTVFVQSYSK